MLARRYGISRLVSMQIERSRNPAGMHSSVPGLPGRVVELLVVARLDPRLVHMSARVDLTDTSNDERWG